MDTGIYTAEGNVAGARAAQLTKEREKMKAEYDALKSSIKKANEKVSTSINDKFSSGNTASLLQPEEAPEVVALLKAEEARVLRVVQGELVQAVGVEDEVGDLQKFNASLQVIFMIINKWHIRGAYSNKVS